MLIALIVCAGVLILDQVTKACLYGLSMSLIGDFLWLEEAFNTGASFGMLKNGTLFFIILSTPLIAFMFWIIFSKRKEFTKFLKISVAILLGGTIGNYIDRIFLGGVRDFIYFKSINFAIFNVADIAITVGAIMLAVYFFIDLIKGIKAKKQEKLADETITQNEDKQEKE